MGQWSKTQTTLRDGEQVLLGRTRRMQPRQCDVLTYDCPACGVNSVTIVANTKEPVRVFCCGRWLTYEEQKPAERGFFATLLG